MLEKLAQDIAASVREKLAAKWVRKWDDIRKASKGVGPSIKEVNSLVRSLEDTNLSAYPWIRTRSPSGHILNRTKMTSPSSRAQSDEARRRGLSSAYSNHSSNTSYMFRKPHLEDLPFIPEQRKLTSKIREATSKLKPIEDSARKYVIDRDIKIRRVSGEVDKLMENGEITVKDLVDKLDPNTKHIFRTGGTDPIYDTREGGLFWSGIAQPPAGYATRHSKFNVAKLPDEDTLKRLNIFATPHIAETDPAKRLDALAKFKRGDSSGLYRANNPAWAENPEYEYVIPSKDHGMPIRSFLVSDTPKSKALSDDELLSGVRLKKIRPDADLKNVHRAKAIIDRIRDRKVLGPKEMAYMEGMREHLSDPYHPVLDTIRQNYKKRVYRPTGYEDGSDINIPLLEELLADAKKI